MTSEEAKWNLMDIKVMITWCVPDEYLEALDVAIKALDKQIPKPFIWKDGNPVCPVCGEEVWDMEWCNSCGQRLDRDVEDNENDA